MNILFLSTWYPYPPTNGSELRAYYILRGLAEAGHCVSALALRAGEPTSVATLAPLDGIDLMSVDADPFRFVALPNVLKFASPVPVALWPIRALRRALDARLIRDASWDAVVAFEGPVAQYLDLFGDSAARVLDIDTSLSYQMRERWLSARGTSGRARAWVSWKKAAAAERRLLRCVDVCTAVSTHEVPHLRELASAACLTTVSANGVDCDHNRRGIASPKAGSLVYNGAMTYSANYDAIKSFLHEIYPLVRFGVPEATLTITGSTTGVDLAALALDDSVRLSGFVDDIRPVVAGSAACVVPLRQGAGTRLKILEAMALGVPVISTTKGAEGLDLIDGEHLLIADGPRDFAAATVWVLQDDALRERLCTQARDLVERRYDWRAIGADFARLVEAAVERKREALCD